MKIDRLIGIITVLLRREKVTAPYLAEKFEVSRRTINRDIEDICRAGIPVVTAQGYDGGISIAEGYKIDKSLLTEKELQAIFIGLKSMDSVWDVSYSGRLQEKLGGGAVRAADHIVIDLSNHYKGSLTPKIQLLQKAMDGLRLVSFRYYYSKGVTERTIEPYLLVFQWSAWYVFGYCLKRQEFRMFKLNRLTDLKIEEEPFLRREVPWSAASQEGEYLTGRKQMTVLFDRRAAYRLVEEYGVDSFSETGDGRLEFSFPYDNDEEMLRWLLSFGSAAQVLRPDSLRLRVLQEAKKILAQYGE